MLTFFAVLTAIAVGYIAAIGTWERLRAWLVGVENEIDALRAKARELEQKLKA